jgi:alkylation response protein AidB-like acyl-CoA dehydrogenase
VLSLGKHAVSSVSSAFPTAGAAVVARTTPISYVHARARYWICKRAPGLVYEAMECHGGNGYTEEWNLARMYRQVGDGAWWGALWLL